MTTRRISVIHICGIPGRYRYAGFYFEVHPYCGPSELLLNGEPVNRASSRKFLRTWEIFRTLRQADKDLYVAK